MIVTEGNKVIITIDKFEVEEYNKQYFEKYPRRRKVPIEGTIPPSLNQWANMHHMARNNLKQNWNDFIIHLVDKYGYTDLGIKKCKMTYTFYWGNLISRDVGNYVQKFVEDGLTAGASGLIEDDNYHIVGELTLRYGGLDRENPRMVIEIERLDLEE